MMRGTFRLATGSCRCALMIGRHGRRHVGFGLACTYQAASLPLAVGADGKRTSGALVLLFHVLLTTKPWLDVRPLWQDSSRHDVNRIHCKMNSPWTLTRTPNYAGTCHAIPGIPDCIVDGNSEAELNGSRTTPQPHESTHYQP